MFQPDPLLWQAIERRRIIRLLYHGKERLVEPHDHGSSTLSSCWDIRLRAPAIPSKLDSHGVEEMADLNRKRHFRADSPPSGKHLRWDILFIRVKPAD